jgi:hypothetical protein
MLTPKANSKQKRVKKAQKRKNRSSDSTHGRAYRTNSRAAQCRAICMVRACRAHGRARLTAQIFRFFAFTSSHIKFKLLIHFQCCFRLRAPYTRYYLILQKNSSFSHPKIAYSKSFKGTYFPKSLKLTFHTKPKFLPKTFHKQNF